MYISKLEIENIRCFDNIVLDFESASDICCGGMILGDNGLGKTTILRCIAISLCGTSSVLGLIEELEGEWIKKGKRQGEVILEIRDEKSREDRYTIETIFTRKNIHADVSITQTVYPLGVEIPADDFFVCGYGAARGIIGVETYSKYTVTDSIYTLFSYDALLQNPELIIRRIIGLGDHSTSEKTVRRVLGWIDKILMLPQGSTRLGKRGLIVKDSLRKSMPVGALADGYQATLTWLMDMLGWALLYDDDIFRKEISGIVLIDEIEHHLHPKWQRSIVPTLKSVFPKLQFIITTHAPLIAANCGDLFQDQPEMKLFCLSQEDNRVLLSVIEEKLGELNAAQVLSSEAFGHIFSINPRIDGFLRDASILAAKDKRTTKEEVTYKKIKDALKEYMFPKGQTLIERIIERDYYMELEKHTEELERMLDEGKG